MKGALEYSCLVTGGRIPAEVSRAVATALRRMEGKRVIVSLREHKRTRSNNQNRYYWGVVVPLVLEMFVDAGNDTTVSGARPGPAMRAIDISPGSMPGPSVATTR